MTISQRKFTLVTLSFVMSSVFGWFKPEFVGDAQTLFNFWIFLIGLYFGANVVQKYNEKKNGNGAAK